MVDSTVYNNRFEALETLTMHLQNDFEQLNEVILKQQAEIQELQSQLVRLEGRLDEQAATASESPRTLEDDKPPHY